MITLSPLDQLQRALNCTIHSMEVTLPNRHTGVYSCALDIDPYIWPSAFFHHGDFNIHPR